jgi:hypothetical protein
MKVTKTLAAAALVPALLIATPVLAASGQITGGDNYLVKNVTKNGQFMDPASADACDVLQYKVRIHNDGPDPVKNINVKASLDTVAGTTHGSTVTVISTDSNPSERTDTATVKLSSPQSLAYKGGTTQLLDANGGTLKTYDDNQGTIFTTGVNIDEIGVSTQQKRYVQFQAQVNCPGKGETPQTPATPATPAAVTPATLPQTGPEAGLAALAGSGALAYAVQAYRRSRRSLANSLRNVK